ncbi:MAG: MgtC/SapB family protein [Flavobacteriales bacterium]|nr:MgtC/SapB family protein [Flavobacteriales bacterium]
MDEIDAVWSQTDVHLVVRLAVAAGIGFLIGLEREFAKRVREKPADPSSLVEKQFAGLRTFTLIALLGFLAAFSADPLGGWFFGIILIGFIALLVTSYIASIRRGDIGATSEVTALITFLLGGLAYEGHLLFIIIVAVLVLLLLSFKLPLHRFVTMLSEQEVRAIIEFVIISLLVLPLLPDQGYGPHGTWNPKEIWTMVILVSGISLAGYLLAKVMGDGRGTLLAGILGGLVSSTAVALSFARQGHKGNSPAGPLALGIVAAAAIMFLRMLLELYVVNKTLALSLTIPLAGIAGAGMVTAWWMQRSAPARREAQPMLTNPLNFRVALQFAVLYALVRWLVVWADARFGQAGTYVAGALAGITDVDAVTLSMARMAKETIWEVPAMITILIAATVNTLVKFTIVLVVGGPELKRLVAPGFAGMAVAAAAGMVWVAVRH